LSHRENVKWSEGLSSKKHPQFLVEEFKSKTTHFVIDKIFPIGMRDQNSYTTLSSVPNVFPAKHAKHTKKMGNKRVFLSRILRVLRAIEKSVG
jgi:hypothetical protein